MSYVPNPQAELDAIRRAQESKTYKGDPGEEQDVIRQQTQGKGSDSASPPSGVLRNGDQSSSVKALQNMLNRLGFSVGTADGKFGPKTEAALKRYQASKGLSKDGIYGPQTRNAMLGKPYTKGSSQSSNSSNSSNSRSGGDDHDHGSIPPAADVTDDGWHGVPPDGEVWKVNGKWMLAYRANNKGPYIYYEVSNDRLKDIFPGGTPRARELSSKQADKLGVRAGSSYLLTSQLGEGWEEGFLRGIQVQTKAQPWLKDPEVLATILTATLEGREVTESELESTKYFSTRSKAEISYVTFAATATSDELHQYKLQFRDTVREQMIEAGIRNPGGSLVNFIATKWAQGEWSDGYVARNVVALSNPYNSAYKLDEELVERTKDMDINTLEGTTREVKEMVKEWLGPHHGANYPDEWYRRWAGRIAGDANQKEGLESILKKQRLALFPEYTDENLTYADIAAPWESMMQQEWGQAPSARPHWNVLEKVIRANDSEEGGRLLRQHGLRLGVQKVANDALGALDGTFGGGVVNART